MTTLLDLLAKRKKAISAETIIPINSILFEAIIDTSKLRDDNPLQVYLSETIDASFNPEIAYTEHEIVPRIRELSSMSELELPKEMKRLQTALLANPNAVSLMLPEDVGTLVKELRRMVGDALDASLIKKPRAASKTTKAKVNNNMDSLFKEGEIEDMSGLDL